MENISNHKNFHGQKRHRRGKMFGFGRQRRQNCRCKSLDGTLANANLNQEYIIEAIQTNNHEMKDFLFTLGCYEGEAITLISIISDQYVVVIKDARYSIDENLAACIAI